MPEWLQVTAILAFVFASIVTAIKALDAAWSYCERIVRQRQATEFVSRGTEKCQSEAIARRRYITNQPPTNNDDSTL